MSSQDSIERRRFLEMMGLAGAAGLAGCSGQSGQDQQQTTTESGNGGETGGDTTTTTTAQTSSLSGGHLRIGVNRKAQTLNPIKHVNAPEYMTTSWMYSKLTRVDTNLRLQPDLATDWEANEDASEWTFSLREGVKFHHNGEQVTAGDVKATLETIQDPDVGSPGQGAIGPIERVEVVDDLTAKVICSGPYADIPKKMAKQFCCIVPAEVINNDFESLATTDYGSGPFVLEEFSVGSQTVLTAYDDYYMTDENGNQLPYVDKLTQKVFPDEAAEISSLQSKGSDIQFETASSQWSRVNNMNGVEPKRVSGGTFPNIVMRSDQPPFNDNRVRKAMKFAVDKEAMLEGAIDGLGTRAHDTPISPAYEFHTELPDREQDLDKAKSLLDDAGVESIDKTLFAANSPAVRTDVAVLFKEALGEIGINVEVKQISYDQYLSNVWSSAPFYVGYYGMRYVADGILYLLLHSKGSWNEAHWTDDEFDAALDEARRTTEKQRRQELYTKAQQILYERGPYVIPFFIDRLGANRNYVDNYNLDPTGFFMRLQSVSLSSDAPTKGN